MKTIVLRLLTLYMKWSVVAERSSASDSSSGVVRMWVCILAWLVAAPVSLSKTLNHKNPESRTQNTFRGRVGVYPGVSGSHSKHPCLQVSSGFRATALKCAFEASLVSLPEMYNNNNILKCKRNLPPFKPVNINNNTACSKCVNLFVDNSVLTVRQNGHAWSLEPSMVTSWHSCWTAVLTVSD